MNLWPVEHFLLGAIANPPKSDGKYVEKSVQVVRGSSFRNDLLQSPYFNCLDSQFFISLIRYHEHEVDDDVVTCETVQDEKCEDVTQGYTTEQKCTKWPREVCTQETQTVLKYSPETDCRKVPRDLCGPSGCVLQPGPEECFDKKETIISEVHIKDPTKK